jgi:uncharacterized phage-associated protein
MINAIEVAKYFLSLSDPDIGDIISNLKLQKLLYYAQGFHLALYDEPLFGENIAAWAHGPVVPDVYHNYKDYGSAYIPIPNDMDDSIFNDNQKDLMQEVYKIFGQFSAWKLRNMTHNEPPWRDTEINQIISNEKLSQYFKTQLVDE